MRVTYTRRLGQHPAGSTRTLTDTEGHWLIRRGLAHLATTGAETAVEPSEPTSAPDDTPDPDTDSLAALKARAESLGLPTYGTKSAIAARIVRHHSEQADGRMIESTNAE